MPPLIRILSPGFRWFVIVVCTIAIAMIATEARAQSAPEGGRWWSDSGLCTTSNGDLANGWSSFQSCEAAAKGGIDTTCAQVFGSGSSTSNPGPNYQGLVGPGNHHYRRWYTCTANTNQAYQVNYYLAVGEDPCTNGGTFDPDNFECSEPAQQCPFAVGENFIKQGDGTAPATMCQQGCDFARDGPLVNFSGGYIAGYAVTGSCSGGDTSNAATGLNCVSNGSASYCVDNTSSANCGTVNGEYVCLDTVPPGNCIFMASGDAVCADGATSETPDLEVAIPDGQGGETTLGIHSGGVSSDGSGGTVGGTNDTDGDGQIGGGSGNGNGEGEGSNVTTPDFNDDGCDFDCIVSGFYADVQSSPLVSSVTGVAVTTGGTCPAPSFTLFDTSFTMDFHCTIGEDIQATLGLLFLGVWGLLGTRIVLSS